MNEEEVFDVENGDPLPLGNGDAPGQPDEDPVGEEIAKRDAEAIDVAIQEQIDMWITDGFVWGQEFMGERKLISVAPQDEERTIEVMLDDKLISPKELIEPLLEAGILFGPFTLAVDEYKDGSMKKFAISQALIFKGIDLTRTVAEVRISAGREIYGFLVNKGLGKRFMLLKVARTADEKRALEKPVFFGHNFGYSFP